MHGSELLDLINNIEKTFPVEQWQLGDIKIWPLIRFEIFFKNVFSGKYGDSSKYSSQNLKKRIDLYSHISLSPFQRKCLKSFLGKEFRHDALFLSNGVSNVLLNGKWYDKFCDPLIDLLGKHGCSSLLLSPGFKHFYPRHNECFYVQGIQDFAKISSLADVSVGFSKKTEQNNEFNELISFLEGNEKLTTLPNFHTIKRRVRKLKILASLYSLILRAVKPSVIFLVCYYGEGMALNLASRELGIPSIDIQHGRQGDNHVAYGRFLSLPKTGYALLPSHFWCWSNYETNAIYSWSKNIDNYHIPMIGGNTFREFFYNGKLPSLDADESLILDIKRQVSSKVHILYTLNGLESDNYLEHLIAVIQKEEGRSFWWLRAHPCRLHQVDKLTKLLDEKPCLNAYINICEASSLPLFIILKNIDLHVTELSSTVLESCQCGIPSIVIGSEGAKIYSEQIKSGWAVSFPNLESIHTFFESRDADRLIPNKVFQDSSIQPDQYETSPALQFVIKQISRRQQY